MNKKLLSKLEKEFLLFICSSSIGTVRLQYDSKYILAASSLINHNLIYQHIFKLPFGGSVEYFSLTNSGWDKCKSLKKKVKK